MKGSHHMFWWSPCPAGCSESSATGGPAALNHPNRSEAIQSDLDDARQNAQVSRPAAPHCSRESPGVRQRTAAVSPPECLASLVNYGGGPAANGPSTESEA
jgi:hypothetical protein